MEKADGSLVTNIIGETVYNGTADDAENIGKVNDVVFDKDGKAESVVIGVGGFLGVGEKNVTYDYAKLQWAEKNGDRWLVAEATKDELTAQPAFDDAPYEPAPAPQAATDTTAPAATTAPADTAMAPADNSASGTATAPADGTAPADMNAAPVEKADGSLASNIIGENVYNGSGDDAENIGNVNDMVLSKDGQAESLIIGVGGFLGVGQKNVAFDYGKATWAEKDGDRWLVAETTKDELTAQPDFDRSGYDPAPAAGTAADADTPPAVTPTTDSAAGAPAADTTAPADTAAEAPAPSSDAAPADTTAEAPAMAPDPAPADQTAEAPAASDSSTTAAIDKSTLTEMPMTGDISSEDLVGTTVYGANDADVGEIGDVVLTPDKKADAVIIDVGGFLGMGEKEVAVGMDNLKFMTDKDGNKYLYTNFTKEQLEAQAAYDKGSYAEKRDEQRMMMTQ